MTSVFFCLLPLAGQAARINSGGVVDAAQYQPVVSPGGIASVFGTDLAPGTLNASTVPLPRQLNGVRVLVNGLAAPIFFTAAGQINIQIPFETPAGAAQVTVERDGVATPPEPVRVVEYAPAIFQNPATTEPIVTRHLDGAVITSANPAKPSDVLIVYLTGIGALVSTPATGEATPASPLPASRDSAEVTLGGRPVTVLYSGLAPGFVGLGQLNIQLPATLPPGAKLPLEVRFGASVGPVVQLPVLYDAPPTPALTVDPRSLSFGDVTNGQFRDLPLAIRSTGTAPLTIRLLASNNPRFTLTAPPIPFTLPPPASQNITVRFSPTSLGSQSGTITISSDDPAAGTVTVPLSGNGVNPLPRPVIDLSPAEMDFREVTVGQVKDLPLTVVNTGTADLNISGVTFSNPQFSVAGLATLVLTPGAQRSITIRFEPTATGDQTTTITVASNDPARPTAAVRGIGKGTGGFQTVVLQVDDGTFERSISLPTGGDSYFINRLTPSAYPATLKIVRIYVSSRSVTPGDSLTVLSAGHPGGADLGAPAFRTTNGRVTTQEAFNDFEVPPITIQSGDFLVGFATPNSAGVLPMAVDQTPPYANRSYISTDGVRFAPAASLGVEYQVDFGIRAVVETGVR